MISLKVIIKTAFSFIFFSQCIVLQSQSSEIYVDSAVMYDYIYSVDSTEMNKTVIFKDQRALIQSRIYYQWGDSEWIENTRSDYSYNLRDSLIEQINYKWYPDQNSWYYNERILYEYDDDGNKIYYGKYGWMEDSMKWVIFWEKNYFFDQKGNNLGYELGNRNLITLEWSYTSKLEIGYNENDEPISRTDYRWNSDSGDWEGTIRREQVYTQGKIESLLTSSWDTINDLWAVYSKKDYAYDSIGFLISEVSSSCDSTEEIWTFGTKYSYINDSSGNVLNRLMYLWDTANNIWFERYKDIYQYDIFGNNISSENYTWDFYDNRWRGVSKLTSCFNQENHLIESKTYNWVNYTDSAKFEVDWKTTFSYNLNGSLTVEANYIYFPGTSEYRLSNKTFYFYDNDLNNTPFIDFNDEEIALYPVPVNNILYIKSDKELGRMEIIDINGRIIKTIFETYVDLSPLSSGVYIVSIYNYKGDMILVQKILKE